MNELLWCGGLSLGIMALAVYLYRQDKQFREGWSQVANDLGLTLRSAPQLLHGHFQHRSINVKPKHVPSGRYSRIVTEIVASVEVSDNSYLRVFETSLFRQIAEELRHSSEPIGRQRNFNELFTLNGEPAAQISTFFSSDIVQHHMVNIPECDELLVSSGFLDCTLKKHVHDPSQLKQAILWVCEFARLYETHMAAPK